MPTRRHLCVLAIGKRTTTPPFSQPQKLYERWGNTFRNNTTMITDPDALSWGRRGGRKFSWGRRWGEGALSWGRRGEELLWGDEGGGTKLGRLVSVGTTSGQAFVFLCFIHVAGCALVSLPAPRCFFHAAVCAFVPMVPAKGNTRRGGSSGGRGRVAGKEERRGELLTRLRCRVLFIRISTNKKDAP